MTLRKSIFWLHLIAGLVAGVVIAIMSFTGVVLAFEPEIVAWAERDARKVTVSPGETPSFSVDELFARLREQHPQARATAVTKSSDPAAATIFALGRDGALYANPYTGEIRAPGSTRVHDFMHLMEDWHRALAMSGDNRATGRAMTGAGNTAFLLLGVTGLYLWWPRKWLWRAVKPSVWFVGAQGKARDWNWHNVIGFWLLPVLIVLTASGMVISYRWASNLVYQTFGETPPAQAGPPGSAPPSTPLSALSTTARPLPYSVIFAAVQKEVPEWTSISIRLSSPARPAGRSRDSAPPSPSTAGGAPFATGKSDAGGASRAEPPRSGSAPLSVTVKEPSSPTFSGTTLTMDPFTGATLKREAFSDLTAGRRARTWLRFLHTGQALGSFGQFLAGLASLGGCFLVYTGFALAWRRFFGRKAKTVSAEN